MAPPRCMSGDDRRASFVGTFLETGDAVALCDECLVPWAASVLHVMAGVDPTPFLAAVSDDVEITPADIEAAELAGDGPDEHGQDPPPRNGKRGRTSRASPAAGTDADPEDATTAPTSAVPPPAA